MNKIYQKPFPGGTTAGFTLIEVLVVVLIIGILAAVALPQYQKTVDRDRLAEAFVLGKHFRDAQQMYYIANGEYAKTFEELAVQLPAGGTLLVPQKAKVKNFTYLLVSGVSGSDVPDRITVESLPGGVALLFMFNGKTRCCSYAASGWRGTGMCKNLGASGEGTDSCGGGGICLCWTLP